MRFVQVIFLAASLLTVIPFVTVLSANALKHAETPLTPANYTIIYQMNAD